jgi:hypothetical protein
MTGLLCRAYSAALQVTARLQLASSLCLCMTLFARVWLLERMLLALLRQGAA